MHCHHIYLLSSTLSYPSSTSVDPFSPISFLSTLVFFLFSHCLYSKSQLLCVHDCMAVAYPEDNAPLNSSPLVLIVLPLPLPQCFLNLKGVVSLFYPITQQLLILRTLTSYGFCFDHHPLPKEASLARTESCTSL